MKRFIETPDSRVPKFYLHQMRFDTVWTQSGSPEGSALGKCVVGSIATNYFLSRARIEKAGLVEQFGNFH
jgi:hypothetical protein